MLSCWKRPRRLILYRLIYSRIVDAGAAYLPTYLPSYLFVSILMGYSGGNFPHWGRTEPHRWDVFLRAFIVRVGSALMCRAMTGQK